MDDEQVRAHVALVESLLEGLDERATEAVAALVQLYGEALRRIIEDVRAHPDITEALTRDELVSHVLILHDLHPTLQLGVEAEKPSPDPKFISLLPGGVIV